MMRTKSTPAVTANGAASETAPDVSICVLSFNGRDVLAVCLDALQMHGSSIRRELIACDNGSSDCTAEFVREFFPEVKLLINPVNEFFTRPFNKMARLARGRYLLILNNDVQITSDGLQRLIAFLDANPRAGAVAPRSRKSENCLEAVCWNEYQFRHLLVEFTFLGHLLEKRVSLPRAGHFYAEKAEQPQKAEVVQDSCMLIRRAAIQEGNLYDEQFRLYFTEDDLCKRLRATGWEVFYYPEVTVQHLHSYTTRRSAPPQVKWVYVHDMLRYSTKYFGALRTNLILRPLAYATLALRLPLWLWRQLAA